MTAPGAGGLTSEYWLARRNSLFVASCIALITTAMSFAIRGDVMTPQEAQFHLSKQEIGWVVSTAFWGFTLAMMFGGPLCDVIGMRRLLGLAFCGHVVGILGTIFAQGFGSLFFATLCMGLGNGFVEAACNPLIATLFPDQKIKRLSLFHAWFPGGIVIGGVVSYLLTKVSAGASWEAHAWQIKTATMLVPLVIYAALFSNKEMPPSERKASGVSTAEMWKACTHPFFLLFVVCMLMTASTELGPQQWFPSILTLTTGIQGIVYLIWITGLMALGRNLAGTFVHRLSPVAILIASSICSVIGLFGISSAHTMLTALAAATVFAAGVCFFWPTMLGIVSERFPKTGALGLAIMGGVGMLSSSFVQPFIGRTYDQVAARAAGVSMDAYTKLNGNVAPAALAEGGRVALQQIVVLPIILTVVFTCIYLYDRSRGGYHKETLIQRHHDEADMDKAVVVENDAATAKPSETINP